MTQRLTYSNTKHIQDNTNIHIYFQTYPQISNSNINKHTNIYTHIQTINIQNYYTNTNQHINLHQAQTQTKIPTHT